LRLLDAAIPGENLDAPFLQLGKQTLDNENEVALGEAHRHSVNDGGKDAQAYDVGNRLLAALLLLLGLDALVSGWPLLLRTVDRAFGVSADFPLCKVSDYAQRRSGLASGTGRLCGWREQALRIML
jgi:hypothetical protein